MSQAAAGRAKPQAGLFVDATSPLTFTFEGRSIPALHGQSIAAALYAARIRIFTRSFKYHRPRGLFCVSGDCPNCLMHVDGRPNVRTCVELARQGQVVTHQNAWPSLGFDVLRVFDKLHHFLPVGFYYKRFHKPRWLWPIFERVVRRVAGLGRIDVRAVPDSHAEVEHLHVDVCVIGGGPAGLAAAAAARDAGADVLLLEREREVGGHLRYEGTRSSSTSDATAEPSAAAARLNVLRETTAFGIYEVNLVGAFRGDRLLKIRARQIIVCTGGRQQPFLFHKNDLPGIFLGRGVLRLARLHGVLAGKRAVILTDNDGGHDLAEQLTSLGIEIAAVVDQRPVAAFLSKRGDWQTLASASVVEARGGKHLKAVRVASVNADGTPLFGSEQEIDCDLLCLASQLVPANELLLQGGMRYRNEGGCWVPDRVIPGLLAAGAAAGTFNLEAQIQQGREAGAYAADRANPRSETRISDFGFRISDLASQPQSSLLSHAITRGKRFVCLCEDVTEKDLEQAVAEGFDHIETLKRYSTVNMGPCQGKMCGQTAAAICARLTSRDLNAVGTTTSRPPAVPVEMCVLAADRSHQPVRRTPLHHWHEQAGAIWLDAGQWKRAESYGDPVAEVRAVRGAVGLIDVSTLGKIELIGPDAAELLERIYLNKWADLKPGRVRYGALCSEEGILFDDGVGARLGPERFYFTATTGNAEAVVQWLELWRDTWRLNATVISHTSGLSAMNLAGPQARNVLGRVMTLDWTPAAFPYMAMREAELAGVPCRLFRIGFVGELGYEIHCPSAQAWHLWEALHGAGNEFGLKPFGVAAQRVLRLEKGHLIIGQDTDALSNPLDAGLEWLVRFDKPMFHGREFLLRLRAMGPRSRLVGFQLEEAEDMPREGCQVVEQGVPVGRVTSIQHSPTLGRVIGLAWVPTSKTAAGARLFIRWNGRDVRATVTALPFYDPDGTRMKS
jgi:sarcosine oxidase subunit alpha